MASCDFCGLRREEVEFLVRSKRGAMPAMICAGCIDDMAATVTAARAAAAATVPARSGAVAREAAD